MGFFSKIAKGIKKALKFAAFPLLKPLKGVWDNLTGKTAAKNMAQTQEAQLKAQAEQSKLNAANEVGNVTKFEDNTDPNFLGDSTRRKKRGTGSFSSGIGLQV